MMMFQDMGRFVGLVEGLAIRTSIWRGSVIHDRSSSG
jgi:hypothetical protein